MPCQNGGSCRYGINRYACECVPGYTGAVCETRTLIVCTFCGIYFSLSVILCPILSAVEQLTVSTADRTIGTLARLSCIPGFTINGIDVLYCKDDGEWSSSIPYCDRKCLSRACGFFVTFCLL